MKKLKNKLKNKLSLGIGISFVILTLTACSGELYTANGSEDMTIMSPELIAEQEDTNDEVGKTEETIGVDDSQSDISEVIEEEGNDEGSDEDADEIKNEGKNEEKDQPKDASQQESTVEFVNQFGEEKTYTLDLDPTTMDNTSKGWSFKRNKDHSPVTGYYDVDLQRYGAYFINEKAKEEKVMYLTFDEGYEYGFTPKILDVLKENNVQATFFLTKYFIDKEPELVKRMADEGHIVGNHSNTHPEFPTLTSDEIYDELYATNARFKEVTGRDMDPFFRAPSGKYSERTLYLTRKLGYRSIFWSMAYKDWEVKNQPGKDVAYNHVMDNYHNGAIILLHAVSESNTEALDDIIKSLKAEGYRFGSLYELE